MALHLKMQWDAAPIRFEISNTNRGVIGILAPMKEIGDFWPNKVRFLSIKIKFHKQPVFKFRPRLYIM
jgi:hypothetical protein